MYRLLKNVKLPVQKSKALQLCVSTRTHYISKGQQNPEGAANILNKQKLKQDYRILSTLQNHSVPLVKKVTLSKEEGQDFSAVFPEIVSVLRDAADKYDSKDAATWFARSLQYNAPGGKKNRGILTVITYKNLLNPKDITPANIKLAQILGWCVELLQCYFIMCDDVMDNGSTRRGQLCWHKLDDVGLIAINDALMIENSIFILLRKYFRNMECYTDLMELFHEISFITTCGQSLDLLNSNTPVHAFSMEKYTAIVLNKTAYYTFYLPFALAMHLAGIKNQDVFRQSKAILLELGYFYQVQDDFLDCYGNPDITGKVGTDIQDSKCSWLAVMCMQKANAEQKQIMLDCYGQNDPEKVCRVKDLYNTLALADAYAVYEEKSYNKIKTLIQQLSCDVPHEIFLQILNKIYHRDS